ncbi:MAG: hypothetical protein E6J91_10020 [Deltaproteobacteria bacterium]|nr:MAG: hypothetical protein E6J91_10020 [Deltaproteobacteria bacterium]
MRIAIAAALVAALAGCHAEASHGTLAVLRAACADLEYWDGTACRPRGDGAARVAAGKQALAKLDVDLARQALDAADRGGPLDHDANVTLWEQRGIAAAYVDDERAAGAAFDMMLALDPGHFLSYTLSPKATFVFEKVRNDSKARGLPALDVNWPHGQRVGDPVPLELEVVADPKQFLHRATVFVRTRGDSGWRAADIALGRVADHRILLPPVDAQRPVSLELYLRAYDDRGNEVLTWADPQRPREIPLRYDPPTPWYRRTWFYAAAGGVLAAAVGVTVYELTLAPPDKVSGGVSVH